MVSINAFRTYPMLPSVVASLFFFAALERLLQRPIFFEWAVFVGFNAALFYFLYRNDRAVLLPAAFLGSIWAGVPLLTSFEGASLRQVIIFILTLLYLLIHFDFRVFHQNDMLRKDAFYLLNVIVLLLWISSLLVLSDFAVISDIGIIFFASAGCGVLARNLFYLRREKTLLALVFALIGGELFWLISFWPFFYLTSAGAFVILIYTLWKMSAEYLEGGFHRFSLFRILGFSLCLLGMLFALTPWLPL